MHVGEIGPHQDRRFHHADEDIDGGAGSQRPADADGSAQDEGHAGDHALQQTPMEQQRRQRANHEDHRKDAEGQRQGRALAVELEGKGAAADIAEDKAGARLGGAVERAHPLREEGHRARRRWNFQQQHGERRLQGDAGDDDARGNGATVLAEEGGEAEQGDEGETAVKQMHGGAREYEAAVEAALLRNSTQLPRVKLETNLGDGHLDSGAKPGIGRRLPGERR